MQAKIDQKLNILWVEQYGWYKMITALLQEKVVVSFMFQKCQDNKEESQKLWIKVEGYWKKVTCGCARVGWRAQAEDLS